MIWVRACPDGGIGRRRGLKIPRSKGCEGSNPSPGTNKIKRLQMCDRFIFWFFRITIPENKHQRRRPGYVRRRPGMNSLPESPRRRDDMDSARTSTPGTLIFHEALMFTQKPDTKINYTGPNVLRLISYFFPHRFGLISPPNHTAVPS